MTTLTDNLKNQIEDPKVIYDMATRILSNFGTIDHQGIGEDTWEIGYSFQDFPNKKLYITGNRPIMKFDSEQDKSYELMHKLFYDNNNFSARESLSVYFNLLGKIPEEFSNLKIHWNNNPLITGVNNFNTLNSKKLMNNRIENSSLVYSVAANEITFKEGEWKDYLAKVFFSTLDAGYYFGVESVKGIIKG
ncbi:MAG: hypothetical protein PF542_00745 [Nanoarchaeota archaeon]|jgi:hypothetical protein|nr:hypothetical protein [Nanoarchaeota archaeon]